MKKMTGKQKGDFNERRTHEYFESQGYIVYSVPQKLPRWTANKDIFNLFDHIAIKDTQVVFIQTKTNRASKKVVDEIKEFSIKYNQFCQVFVWKDDDTFTIYR